MVCEAARRATSGLILRALSPSVLENRGAGEDLRISARPKPLRTGESVPESQRYGCAQAAEVEDVAGGGSDRCDLDGQLEDTQGHA